MSDLLIYTIIATILIVFAFGLRRSFAFRNPKHFDNPIPRKIRTASSDGYAADRESSKAEVTTLDREVSSENPDQGYSLTPEAEAMTRSLIGDEAFETMKFTVENLLDRHKDDRSVTISLTSGCESSEASRVLHSLLPGDELSLRKNVECGLSLVDVYAAGYRVGRLLLGDADVAFSVMHDNDLTGAYVAEQNCYGDCNVVDMKIILFFSPRASVEYAVEKNVPYKITVDGVKPLVIFQN